MPKKLLFSLCLFFLFAAIAFAEQSANPQSVISDKRTKQEIKPFTDGLKVITRLNPIHYIYNGKADTPKGMAGIGLIAQDIKDIAPYTVITYKGKLNPQDKEETTLFTFNSGPLTFILINAIKEQQKEIEALKKDVGQLKEQLKPAK